MGGKTDRWSRFDKSPGLGGGYPQFDMWPDVSGYASSDLHEVDGYNTSSGPAKLFSSFKSGVVNLHFEMMTDHGIDGAFLQRWVNQCEPYGDQWSELARLTLYASGIMRRD